MIGFSEIRAQAWKYLSLVLAVLAVAAVIAVFAFWGRSVGDRARADAAATRAQTSEAKLQRANEVLAEERRKAADLAQIAEWYEREKVNAEAEQGRLVSDLRAGNQRLRGLWQGCQATGRLSEASRSAAELDAADRLREESAGRIVGTVRACQIQRDALIDVIEADRK